MLPHPDTAHQVATLYHRQLQTEAARERLAGQALASHRPAASFAARFQDRLGAALVRSGQRLQGIPSLADAVPAAGLPSPAADGR